MVKRGVRKSNPVSKLTKQTMEAVSCRCENDSWEGNEREEESPMMLKGLSLSHWKKKILTKATLLKDQLFWWASPTLHQLSLSPFFL